VEIVFTSASIILVQVDRGGGGEGVGRARNYYYWSGATDLAQQDRKLSFIRSLIKEVVYVSTPLSLSFTSF
jgi:hypothetical protein